MNEDDCRFKCNFCEQEYFEDSFTLALMLYGIFYLLKKDSGYAGITCPKCLKTIIREGERSHIDLIRKNLSFPIQLQHN